MAASVIAADTGAAKLLTIMAPELAFFLRVFVVVPKDLPRADGLSSNALAADLASLEKAGRSGAYEDDGGAVVARQDLLNVVSFAEKSDNAETAASAPFSTGDPRRTAHAVGEFLEGPSYPRKVFADASTPGSKATIKWRVRSTL